ncbi:MAG: amidohydrolase family protein, partial [Chloroflexi bacterium]|nr:amidohydrolase family protein [Chloroflexota bacterium]
MTGGRVIDPAQGIDRLADVLLKDGVVEAVTDAPGTVPGGYEVIDATGLVVAPGFIDIHTHLYPAEMGSMYLAGPDNLITYHYLKVETSRNLPLNEVEGFNLLPTDQQADIVWKTLFAGDASPISEAQLGIVTVMSALG